MSRQPNARQILRAVANLGLVASCLALAAPLSAGELKLRATFRGHPGARGSLAFSPDGKMLASGARLWDVATGRNTATLKEERPYLWGTAVFSPNGKALATGGSLNKVKLWDVATLKGKILLDERKQCPETLVVFSPDGKTLASGGVCRREMKLFDVATGKIKASLVTEEGGNDEGVLAMAFTPDSKTLVSVGRPDEIRLWDVATGKNTVTRKTSRGDDDDGFARITAAISSDTKTVATVIWVDVGKRSVAKEIKLWSVATGKEQATLKGHTRDVWSLAFSPDGKTLASGCEDGTIKLWDVARSKELATLKGHESRVSVLAFSPDGNTLASGSEDKTIKLWDVAKSK
jgi:WD40 repeat protein